LKQDSLSNGRAFQTEPAGAARTLNAISVSGPKLARLKSGARRIAALTAAIVILSSFVAPKRAQADEPVKATYVGVEVCAGCHQTQAERWKTSHHALAMEKATAETVLGDFSGV
jgi:cytochrome c553